MMSAEWVWICCVREFKCVDLRAVNRRTRTRLLRTREMGGGRRRQRTGLRTVSVVSILVCVRAHTFDQWLLCDPSWVIADERAHTPICSQLRYCKHVRCAVLFSVITQRSLFQDLQKELARAAEVKPNMKGQLKTKQSFGEANRVTTLTITNGEIKWETTSYRCCASLKPNCKAERLSFFQAEQQRESRSILLPGPWDEGDSQIDMPENPIAKVTEARLESCSTVSLFSAKKPSSGHFH